MSYGEKDCRNYIEKVRKSRYEMGFASSCSLSVLCPGLFAGIGEHIMDGHQYDPAK